MNARDWEGYAAGTRVRAVLDIVYIVEDVEIAEGTEGVVVERQARGLTGLASIRWDGHEKPLATVVSSVQALGF